MPSNRKSKGPEKMCCVPQCRNKQSFNSKLMFYEFPNRKWETERKKIWIARIQRENKRNWAPTKHARICSAHFINGYKSNDPKQENFNPTIFPWKPKNASALNRRKRIVRCNEKKNLKSICASTDLTELRADFEDVDTLPVSPSSKKILKAACEISVQTEDILFDESEGVFTFHFWQDSSKNEASTQTVIPVELTSKYNSESLSDRRKTKKSARQNFKECSSSKTSSTFSAEVDPLAVHEDDLDIIVETHCVKNKKCINKEEELFIIESMKVEPEVLENINESDGHNNNDEIETNDNIEENVLGPSVVISNVVHTSSFESTNAADCIESSETPVTDNERHKKHQSCSSKVSPEAVQCSAVPNSGSENPNKIHNQYYTKTHKTIRDKNIVYLCEECNKTFSDFSDFCKHYDETHKEANNLQCVECHRSYSSLILLQRHIDIVHRGINFYSCKICDLKFPYPSNLKRHIKLAHLDVDFTCVEVDLSHKKSAVDLTHNKNVTYNCGDCGKIICHKRGLKRHIHEVHLKIQDFMCEQCGHKFSNACTLNNHIRSVHEKNKTYNCKECEKKFSWSGGLSTHIRVVHKREMRKCKQCDKEFTQWTNLKRHIRIVHPNNENSTLRK